MRSNLDPQFKSISLDSASIDFLVNFLTQQQDFSRSKAIIDTIAMKKATAIPTGDEGTEFFQKANAEPGVMLRACMNPTGGCQDWGKSIQAEFPKMDSLTGYIYNISLDKKLDATLVRDPQQWKYIVITGCEGINEPATFVDLLKGSYQFPNVKNIFVIGPPISNPLYDELQHKKEIQDQLGNPNLKLTLLKGGLDLESPSNIGIPKPYPEAISSYVLPQDCYGLMYDNLQKTYPTKTYLQNYFQQIAKIPSVSRKSVMVISTAFSQDKPELLRSCAAAWGISINIVDKLPQADFIQAIKQIGRKGGFLSIDGAQTLLQALCLNAKVLIPANDHNKYFYAGLISKLPPAHREIADVIFGFYDDFELLNDSKKVEQVYQELQQVVKASVAKFDKSNAANKAPETIIPFNFLPNLNKNQNLMTEYLQKVEIQPQPWLSKFLGESSSPVVSKGPGLFGQRAPSIPQFVPESNSDMELESPRAVYA